MNEIGKTVAALSHHEDHPDQLSIGLEVVRDEGNGEGPMFVIKLGDKSPDIFATGLYFDGLVAMSVIGLISILDLPLLSGRFVLMDYFYKCYLTLSEEK